MKYHFFFFFFFFVNERDIYTVPVLAKKERKKERKKKKREIERLMPSSWFQVAKTFIICLLGKLYTCSACLMIG